MSSFGDQLAWSWVQGISGQNAYQDLQKRNTPEELKNYDPSQYWFTNPQMREGIEQARQAKLQDFLVKEATPRFNNFRDQYEQIAGTTDPRFLGDAASRQEMVKAGLNIPVSGNNPILDKGVTDFIGSGRTALQAHDNAALAQKDYVLAQQGNPEALARLATGAKFDNMPNVNAFIKNAAEEKRLSAESAAKLAADAQKTATATKQLDNFGYGQKLAAENLGFIGTGQDKGDYLSAPEVRAMTAQDISKLGLDEKQIGAINAITDKGLSDKWLQQKSTDPLIISSQVNPYTGERKVVNDTRANIVTKVNTEGTYRDSLAKAFGPSMAKDISDSFTTAQKAADILTTANLMKSLEGTAITGWGAEKLSSLKNAAASLQIPIDGLTPTQAYNAVATGFAIQGAKALGANPTERDLEAVMKSNPGVDKPMAANIWLRQQIEAKNSKILETHNSRIKGVAGNLPDVAAFYTVQPPSNINVTPPTSGTVNGFTYTRKRKK